MDDDDDDIKRIKEKFDGVFDTYNKNVLHSHTLSQIYLGRIRFLDAK